jgi:putative nucleotidyltransferase with HDIG domain
MIGEMKMMNHIIDHSVMVSNVALCIARSVELNQPGINIPLVRTASLLHDITKTRSFDTGEVHSETGGILLAAKGFPEIADIIRQHVILEDFRSNAPVTEPEIVNYADKRVLHDKVVSLDCRLEYIQVRYGNNPALKFRIQKMWQDTLALEKKLFACVDFRPAQLAGHVKPEVNRPAGQDTI